MKRKFNQHMLRLKEIESVNFDLHENIVVVLDI